MFRASLLALACCGGFLARAEAGVTGSNFTATVISLSGGASDGTMSFQSPNAFQFTGAGGFSGTYTEQVNSTTGNTSVTVVLMDGLNLSGVAVGEAQTISLGVVGLNVIYGLRLDADPAFFFGYEVALPNLLDLLPTLP